jgi:hypothetical protein
MVPTFWLGKIMPTPPPEEFAIRDEQGSASEDDLPLTSGAGASNGVMTGELCTGSGACDGERLGEDGGEPKSESSSPSLMSTALMNASKFK